MNSFVGAFQEVLNEILSDSEASKYTGEVLVGEYRVAASQDKLEIQHEITVSCKMGLVRKYPLARLSPPSLADSGKIYRFRIVIAAADDYRYLDEIRPILEEAAREICQIIFEISRRGGNRGDLYGSYRKFVKQIVEEKSDGTGAQWSKDVSGPTGTTGKLRNPDDLKPKVSYTFDGKPTRPLSDDLRRLPQLNGLSVSPKGNWGSYVAESRNQLLPNQAPDQSIGYDSAAPSKPKVGSLWYDTNSQIMFIWDGTGWQRAIWDNENSAFQTQDGSIKAGMKLAQKLELEPEAPKLGARKLQID